MIDTNNTNDTVDKVINATTITGATNNARSRQYQRGRGLKRKRGIEKMIMLETRVSGKHSEFVSNPKGPDFRRVHDWVLGNVMKSIKNNRHEIKFNNGVIRRCSS